MRLPNLLLLVLGMTAVAQLHTPNALCAEPEKPKQKAADSFVEFDFSTVPERVGRRWELIVHVTTSNDAVKFKLAVNIAERFSPVTLADSYRSSMEEVGYKVELVDKLKLRVYGCTVKDKFYSVREGKVESPQVTKDQLPAVTNPTKN